MFSTHNHKALSNPLRHLGMLLNEEYGLYIMAEPLSAVITYTDEAFYVETYLFDGYELASEGYTEDEITAYILANTQHPFYLVSCKDSYGWSIVDLSEGQSLYTGITFGSNQ